MLINKKLYKPLALALLASSLTYAFSVIFIKNIGELLYLFNENQLGDIFLQLKDSNKIYPPIIINLILYSLLFISFKKKLPLMIILIPVIVIISTLLTSANGIYFIDIIISLINNIGGLGLWKKLTYSSYWFYFLFFLA